MNNTQEIGQGQAKANVVCKICGELFTVKFSVMPSLQKTPSFNVSYFKDIPLRPANGRLKKKVQTRSKFGYPLPPLNLGHH